MREVQWSDWARGQLLPFPGDAWTVNVDLKKAEAKVPGVPEKPKLADEIKRGIKLRLNETYDEKGNRAKDSTPANLVDIWCTRAGVAFATEVLIGVCAEPQLPSASTGRTRYPYKLRQDGQPWARLREHLAAASPEERTAARKLADKARSAKSEIKYGLAYAFCEPAWVTEDLEAAITEGYGRLAVLGAVPDAKTARAGLLHLMGKDGRDETPARYQLIEESYPHIPNLMVKLDDADAPLLLEAAKQAWNTKTRKPWLEIAACLPGDEAKAFLAEHGYAAKPAKAAAAKPAKAAAAKPAKAAAAKPAKPAKAAAKKPAKKK